MTIRTRQETLTFSRSFVLDGIDAPLPAGDYLVETDEQRLEGVSLPVYRRIAVLLHLHPSPSHPGRVETLSLEPAELDAALARDRAAVAAGDGPSPGHPA